jgi:hypothetical protein
VDLAARAMPLNGRPLNFNKGTIMQSKTRRTVLVVSMLAGALAFAGLTSRLQADDKLVSPPKADQAEKVELFSGKIEELNLEKKTLVVAKQTYQVVETTKVMDKEKPIKLADLKAGMEVHGLARKDVAGKPEITIIKLGLQPKDSSPYPKQPKE